MRRNRGSAYVYVLLMVVSITLIALAIADSSLSFSIAQTRGEHKVQAEYVLDGAMNHVEVARVYSRIAVPSTSNITLDGTDVKLDYRAATDPNQMQVTATATVANQTYTKVGYTGRSRPTPFHFAVASGGPILSSNDVRIASEAQPGALWVNGAVSLTNQNASVNGDIEANGSIAVTTVTGAKYPNLSGDIFTRAGLLDYLTLAGTKLVGNQSWTGYTFAAVGAASKYPLILITGDLDISGVISGKGTVYVTGSVRTKGDITYADANSKVVIIAAGNIDLKNNVVGYFYAMNTVSLGTAGIAVHGAMIGAVQVQMANNGIIGFDPYIALNPEEGTRFWLPGY